MLLIVNRPLFGNFINEIKHAQVIQFKDFTNILGNTFDFREGGLLP